MYVGALGLDTDPAGLDGLHRTSPSGSHYRG
jgi:hypothetical protein